MYKVETMLHTNEIQLQKDINDWIEENPDHSLVSFSTIEGKGIVPLHTSFVVFKDHTETNI